CGPGTRLASLEPQRGHFEGPCLEDPFRVPRSQKLELLEAASAVMCDDPRISLSRAALWFERRKRVFASTEGSLVSSDLVFSMPFLMAFATHGDDAQSRSLQDGARIAGWEWIDQTGLTESAVWVRDQAIEKVLAGEPEPGVYDLVLDGLHLGLTIHESVGHPTESDRALGWEANMAGRTFLSPDDRGSLRYGSDLVNLVADNTLPYGLASWGWDDEGVPGQRWYLVRNGIFQEFGTVRETAAVLGTVSSRGCCRAEDFASFQINRQPNLYLEPGKVRMTPEDIISATDSGILIEGRGSFSISQRRVNFQFGGDRFTRIRAGKLAGPLKKVIYRSTTKEFWGSCDMIADERCFRTMGLLNCGKGEPLQSARMTHGASHSRFRGITVGGEIQ
ncbi:TldD/PmbA family protein, partial [Candidatus Fermentibacterales bacterium]|nr:TldD/PmbA family protein [Candidatus Fermentibacterales bacterium]